MKYYRVHTEDIAYITQQPRGIQIYRLKDLLLINLIRLSFSVCFTGVCQL